MKINFCVLFFQEVQKVKSQCEKEAEERLKGEHSRWRETELVREIEVAREKWFTEIDG